jgi:hypothetical protein
MTTLRIEKALIVLATLGGAAFSVGCSDDESGDGDDGASTTGGTSNRGGSSSGGTATGGTATGGTSTGGTGGSGATQARVRVLHLSPDAPGVDVFANGGDEPVVENLEFPDGTPYLSVPPGTYTFDVSASGSSADDAVLTVEDLELEAGGSYTAVAFDELSSISALALVDDYEGLAPGDIRIRAVHAASTVGEVDIWDVTTPSAAAPLYEDVPFGVAGDALDVPAGAYSVGIDVDDDATPDLTFDLPALPGGTVANLYAVAADGDVFLVAQLPDGTTARIDPR